MSQASLIIQAEQQPELLPAARSFLASLENEGEFTGERLHQQRPEVYQSVVALLARGWGCLRIARELSVSTHTVRAVRKREGETIALARERLADMNFALADEATEAAREVIADILTDRKKRDALTVKDAQSLAIVAGVAAEKAQLFSGGPTVRVEVHEFAQPQPADFANYLTSLRSANPTHLVGEKTGQKEGAPADAQAGTDGSPDLAGATDQPTADSERQSPVSP